MITFDAEALYIDLDRRRRALRLRWRDVAQATGRSASTFTRLSYGGHLSADALVASLAWLGETDISRYTIDTSAVRLDTT
jgi:hypothetical protein